MSSKMKRIQKITYLYSLFLFCCLNISAYGDNRYEYKLHSSLGNSSPYSRFQNWSHEITLENGMKINWDATDEEWLTMEVSALVQGYVAVGFSPNGGMAGSDIVMGWVDDNQIPHLQDYHAFSNSEPKLDTQQDYQLLRAIQNDNSTLITFRRKWTTCDEQDFALGDDTVRLIWAFSDFDPVNGELHYHDLNRGTRSVFLKSVQRSLQFPDDYPENTQHSVKEWQVNFHNFHVPVQETTYHCKIFTFPSFTTKQHIIGYRPITQVENRPYVHHATLSRCTVPPSIGNTHKIFEKYLNHPGGDCLTGEVPFDWNKYCYEFMIATAIGAEGEMFPEDVGLPILPDGDGEFNYIRLEIHYDNPKLHKIVDSSGIKMFYTDQLRKHDIGVAYIGHRTTPFQVIPPNQESFTTFGICPGSCTRAAFPESGVQLFGALLHAHTAGRKIRLKHVRDGIELSPISVDNHYDFNYQQYRSLEKEVAVLPGDDLIVECDYNSVGRPDSVIGGLPSAREMCATVIWFYPAVELKDCRSQPEFNSFFEALDMKEVHHPLFSALQLPMNLENFTEHQWAIVPPDDSLIMTDKFPQYRSSETNPWRDIHGHWVGKSRKAQHLSVQDAIELKSLNSEDAKILQDKWGRGLTSIYCAASGGERVSIREIIQKFPKYEDYRLPETKCTRLATSSAAGSNTKKYNSIFILICFSFTVWRKY